MMFGKPTLCLSSGSTSGLQGGSSAGQVGHVKSLKSCMTRAGVQVCDVRGQVHKGATCLSGAGGSKFRGASVRCVASHPQHRPGTRLFLDAISPSMQLWQCGRTMLISA
jgi:hypothetical protein